MSLEELYLSVSWGITCVLWCVQLVIYPSFHAIDTAQFQTWHRRYTRSITFIVAPLILGQGILLGLLFLQYGATQEILLQFLALAIAWSVTFLLAVPLHRALEIQSDERSIQNLIRINWIRTGAWSLALIAAMKAR